MRRPKPQPKVHYSRGLHVLLRVRDEGMPQTKVVAVTGVRQSVVSLIENQQRIPSSWKDRQGFAKLGIEPDWWDVAWNKRRAS